MIQIVESGWQVDDGPIRWHSEHPDVYGYRKAYDHTWGIDSAHRRRILDREAARDNHPQPDGWLVIAGLIVLPGITNYQRIRWVDELEEACR